MFKKSYIVGLDIGSSSVKLAQFAKRDDGLHLIKVDVKSIAYSDDEAQLEKEYTSALKEIFKGIDQTKSDIIAGINCPATSIKKVTLPQMPASELREAIKLKAKDYFHFDTDSAIMDFEIMREVVDEGVRKYELTVAASPRATVERHLKLLEKAGIKPASLVPCSCALQKFIIHSSAEKDKTQGFVDIGAHFTEFLVFKGEELLFSRKIPVAGSDITKSMTGTLVSDKGKTQLSIEEAEKIKKDIGIPAELDSRMIEDKISAIQVLSMMRPPLEQLVGEIDRCFDYYREGSRGGMIDTLVLLGGGASLKGLPEFLSTELGIEVKVGVSLKGIEVEPGAVTDNTQLQRFGAAIGAALSAGLMSLLPPEIKEEKKKALKRAVIEGISVGVVIILALIYIGMKIQLGNLQKKVSVAQKELSGLVPYLERLKTHNLVTMILVDEPFWEEVFKEFSNIVPEDIYLTNLSKRGNIVEMKGVVTSERADEALSDFIFILERAMFKDVKLVGSKDLKGKEANEFTLRCWVD